MKILYLAMIASLALQSAASAALGPDVEAQNYTRMRPDQIFGGQSITPQTRDHLVRNPNECAADHAEPVWSATSTLLGYVCSHNENGG